MTTIDNDQPKNPPSKFDDDIELADATTSIADDEEDLTEVGGGGLAVVAEQPPPTINTDKPPSKQNKMVTMLFLVVVIAIIVVGVTTGAIVGVRNNKNCSSDKETSLSANDPTSPPPPPQENEEVPNNEDPLSNDEPPPADDDTEPPVVNTQDEEQQTEEPPTETTTQGEEEEPPEEVVVEPVQDEELPSDNASPPNDLCVNAIPLLLTGTVTTVSGTTLLSTFEDLGYSRFQWNDDGTESFGFPNELDFVDQELAICDYRQTPGVWYTVKGRGTGIRVSTCDHDSTSTEVLSVYQGQDCASLNCVVNYSTRCGDHNQQSTLTWFGETDQTYYIYVATTDDVVTTQGSFTLQLSEFETPSNDFCAGAEPLAVGETFAATVQGATAEFIGNGLFNDWEGDILPGAFYTVIGTGAVMKAAAPCNENARVRVFVYQGNCDKKMIVGEKVVCEPDSAAYWESAEGEIYHILLQSDSSEPINLSVTEERPELNDLCTGAAGPIQVGSVIEGDNTVARWSQYDRRHRRERDLLSVAPPGLFYTVIGTGGTLQVSAPCEQGIDTVSLYVFAGACQYDQREDVSAARTWCEPDFSVTWPTVEGVVYYIQVTPGLSPDLFQFTLIEQ